MVIHRWSFLQWRDRVINLYDFFLKIWRCYKKGDHDDNDDDTDDDNGDDDGGDDDGGDNSDVIGCDDNGGDIGGDNDFDGGGDASWLIVWKLKFIEFGILFR